MATGDEKFMQDVRSQKDLDGLGCLVSQHIILNQHNHSSREFATVCHLVSGKHKHLKVLHVLYEMTTSCRGQDLKRQVMDIPSKPFLGVDVDRAILDGTV